MKKIKVVVFITVSFIYSQSLQAQKMSKNGSAPKAPKGELTNENMKQDEYIYKFINKGGNRFLMRGELKTLSVEPRQKKSDDQTLYFGSAKYVFHLLAKDSALVFRNDSVIAIIGKQVTLNDREYKLQQGKYNQWRILTDGKIIIDGVFRDKLKDPLIIISHDTSAQYDEALTVIILYQCHLTQQHYAAMRVGSAVFRGFLFF